MTTGGAAVGTATARYGAERVALTWMQQSGLIGLSIVNFLLRIVTLGIYHFWGKTEVRRRIWSAVRLNGEPLEYTGTGKELFLGFLVVLAVVFLPITLGVFAVTVVFGPNSLATATVPDADLCRSLLPDRHRHPPGLRYRLVAHALARHSRRS